MMQSEKMMILKMLEDGKINADEASRLLASASGEASHTPAHSAVSTAPAPRIVGHDPQRPHGTPGDASRTPGEPKTHDTHDPRSNNPGGTPSEDGMGTKITNFIKEMEPKVKKLAGQVANKTVEAADSISQSFKSGGASSPSHYSSPDAKPANAGIEEVVEIKVEHTGGELNLASLNGQVIVKGYNGDKISAKIYTVAKRPGATINLATLGNKYYLSYDENDFERVSIDAFVPEGLFNAVKISATNGDLDVATIAASHVFVEAFNGRANVCSIKANNLDIETNNGALTVKNTTAHQANIENFNGGIFINKIDIGILKASTFNGGIDMQIADFKEYDNYKWSVETSNGKLLAVLPTYSTLGYHIKGHAALDSAKLGLTGMNYLRHDASSFEAVSVNFDTCLKKVEIELATSNAPLTVN